MKHSVMAKFTNGKLYHIVIRDNELAKMASKMIRQRTKLSSTTQAQMDARDLAFMHLGDRRLSNHDKIQNELYRRSTIPVRDRSEYRRSVV